MKAVEIRQKSAEELDVQVRNLRKELFDLRFQTATEQIENPSRIRQIRRTIARVRTVNRERELETQRTES